MLLRGVQQKYVTKSHFKNFESALYSTSVSMSLKFLTLKQGFENPCIWCFLRIAVILGVLVTIGVTLHIFYAEKVLSSITFASVVLCHNPPLPDLLDHTLPLLSHDQTQNHWSTGV